MCYNMDAPALSAAVLLHPERGSLHVRTATCLHHRPFGRLPRAGGPAGPGSERGGTGRGRRQAGQPEWDGGHRSQPLHGPGAWQCRLRSGWPGNPGLTLKCITPEQAGAHLAHRSAQCGPDDDALFKELASSTARYRVRELPCPQPRHATKLHAHALQHPPAGRGCRRQPSRPLPNILDGGPEHASHGPCCAYVEKCALLQPQDSQVGGTQHRGCCYGIGLWSAGDGTVARIRRGSPCSGSSVPGSDENCIFANRDPHPCCRCDQTPTPVPVDDMPAKVVAIVEQDPVGFPPPSPPIPRACDLHSNPFCRTST